MTSPTDPAHWPSAPPPLPPTLPSGPPPGGPGGSVGTPPPTPRPPSAGRTGLIAGVVAVVVVLVLAAAVVAVRSASTDDTASPTTTSAPPTTSETTSRPSPTDPTAPADPGAGAPADIEAEVAQISSFVEQERGLEFTEPVEVTALAPDAFKDRVLQEFETEKDALETEGALLRAGGIVPPDTDIVQSQLDLLGDGVLGFYDPITKELVVRSDSAGPLVRSVIAHELTHALDDQHFGLDRPELDEVDDGSDWAFLALVEGSAKRVENAYIAQFSPDEQDQYATDQLELALDQMDTMFSSPLVLAQILMSPYDYGAPFVDAILLAGGQDRLDAAFAEPPTSSEQILDATRFDGDQPIDVPTPPAEGEILGEGVLGQLFTGFLVDDNAGLDDLLGGIDPAQIDDLLGNLDLGDLEAMLDELSGGSGDLGGLGGLGGDTGGSFPPIATTPDWGGDHYVVWQAEDQLCLRVDWVMDTPEALTSFRSVIRSWATRDPSVTVADPTPDVVRATRCAPDPASGSGTP